MNIRFIEWMKTREAWDHTGSGAKMQGDIIATSRGLSGENIITTLQVWHDGTIKVGQHTEGGNEKFNPPAAILAQGTVQDVMQQLKDQPEIAQKVQQATQHIVGNQGPFQGQHG